MSHIGWLEETWDGDFAGLARALSDAWPEELPKDNTAEALRNRLAGTDAGKSTAKWWRDHDLLVPTLAHLLRRSDAEVRSWIEACTRRPSPGSWSPPGLRSIAGARVDEPPPGLWSDLVEQWVRALEAGQTNIRRAWLRYEPGVAGDWLREWFEDRGWKIIRAESWTEAEKKVVPRTRTLVHLSGMAPTGSAPPNARSTATICVLARSRPPWSGRHQREEPLGEGWRAVNVPVYDDWAALDATTRPDLRGVIRWFADHARADRQLGDEELGRALADLGADATPGELLARLDVGRDDDPVAAMTARWADECAAELLAVEKEAARRGVGPLRVRATWEALVLDRGSPEETLAAVRRSLSKRHYAHAERMAANRPKAMVDRWIEQGVLQPCGEPGAPADAWRVWPRWLGTRLSTRAVAELATHRDTIGAALLASEEGCHAALDQLERLVADNDWERVGALLSITTSEVSGAATVEGAAFALGNGILDGTEVPVEVAAAAVESLVALRERSRGARLLAHGDGRTSTAAATMAEWALGCRSGSSDSAFGPWAGAPLDSAQHIALRDLDDALERWVTAAQDRRRVDERSGHLALARRALRLGTLLFERRGTLPVEREDSRGVWSFQVPALLVAASQGAEALPGRTVDDVLRDQAPGIDLPALAREGERLFAGGLAGPIDDAEAAGRAVVAVFAKKLAEDAPDARARERAIRAILNAASNRFSLVRAEIVTAGASPLGALRWLWSQWNSAQVHDRTVPPVALLREDDLDDARLLWTAAPPEVHREIWRRASRESALWEVLPAAGWRAWARAETDVEAGWERMPLDVLVSLLDGPLPAAAYSAAWRRTPPDVFAWMLPRVTTQGEIDPSARRCLDAAPALLVPEVLARVPAGLPTSWLQRVVTERLDGWREAWGRLRA